MESASEKTQSSLLLADTGRECGVVEAKTVAIKVIIRDSFHIDAGTILEVQSLEWEILV